MRYAVLTMALGLMAGAATAQTADPRFESAPWWATSPVLPQIGYAEREVEANRATFTATFRGVGKTAAEAQNLAIAQATPLMTSLRKQGAEVARITTGFDMQALYQQYKVDGEMVDNERGDKIRGYEANLSIEVEVRDLAGLERIYALALAASPTQVSRLSFRLEADNAVKTALLSEAGRDAAARAQGAAQVLGVQVGGVRMIDPTGRACQSNLLGRQKPEKAADGSEVQEVVVAGSRAEYRGRADSVVADDVGAFPDRNAAEAMQRVAGLEMKADENAFLQTPPLYKVRAQTCVVYGLK
ncbi:SIMPL domain-containing protein [Asticcacaulis sp. BYS171W]|uniref:SIMPL domain-containing protein n=1 Tax=Asticcacaulis aquaticus TaxID=2984212 RepID=A0ABT5HR80_9CAUL|nr:SIMPL domain-containing protein [Asticcacaulis aquaticus]MDC7682570.1 SIMPL domain-containing protein [Asticcacaulis aquaticus]